MGRDILQPRIDPMSVIHEIASGAMKDAHGLTLGDVSGHRVDRYFTVWRTLHFVGALARIGLVRRTDVLDSIQAEVQDNHAIGAYQAAHVLPCDFSVNGKNGFWTLLQSPFVRNDV